jgi:hypothetical protein
MCVLKTGLQIHGNGTCLLATKFVTTRRDDRKIKHGSITLQIQYAPSYESWCCDIM